MLKYKEHVTEASEARSLYPLRKYATDGKNIPLKKNWSETWYTSTKRFETYSSEFLNFNLKEDDVFLVTYMKAGTTWMQECAWLLLNNLNYEKAKENPIMVRSPFLEYHGQSPFAPNHVELLKTLKGPRLIKSHLAANLLPLQIWEKKQKIIYVARNVKDVIVSSYHFLQNMGIWKGDNLQEYVNDFINDVILFTNYWNHVVDFWRMRNESFIFFVTYEEMKKDLETVLRRLSDFLGKPQLSAEDMKDLVKYVSFDNMKSHKHTNVTNFLKEVSPRAKEGLQFMRRGIVGSFKDELTPELIAKIDKWSSESLGQYGIKEEDIFGKF